MAERELELNGSPENWDQQEAHRRYAQDDKVDL